MGKNYITSKYKIDIFMLVFLLFIGAKYIFNVSGYTDIQLYDESVYLNNGVKLLTKGFPDASYGPLYCIYYYILSIFQGDQVKLYYLNYILLTISMPITAYICFRSFQIKIMPAFLLSILMLISHANLNVHPKTSLLALYITFITTLFIKHVDRIEYKLFIASISLIAVAYVRPEVFFSFLVMAAIFIVHSIVSGYKHNNYTGIKLCLGLLVLVGVFYFTIELPVFGKGGSRSIVAFGQHFSVNWVGWTGSKLEPWTNWEMIVAKSFGAAKTVTEAIVNNPRMFLKHINQNLHSAPVIFSDLFRYDKNIIIPDNFSCRIDLFLLLVMSLFLVIKCSYVNFKFCIKQLAENKLLFVYLTIAAIPGSISAILVYPRNQLLLPSFALIMVLIGMFLSGITREPDSLKTYISYGLLFIFAIPCMSDYKPRQSFLETKSIIQEIRRLNITKPVNILEIDGGYATYQKSNYRWVSANKKDTDFSKYVINNNINMIVVSDRLLNSVKFNADEQWHQFISNYSSNGYKKIEITGSNKYILLHNSLI